MNRRSLPRAASKAARFALSAILVVALSGVMPGVLLPRIGQATAAPSRTQTVHIDTASLGDALDTTGLTWETFGDSAWFVESATTHDGVDAAQSGPVADYSGGYSGIRTTVTGPGKLYFWIFVDSYFTHYVQFKIDGSPADLRYYGQFPWNHLYYEIPAGEHVLSWEYHKDTSYSGSYSDAAYLDQVEWLTYTITGTMAINNGDTSTTSANVTLNSSVTNAAEMRFSNSGGEWSDWEPYSPTRSWALTTGSGTKTVEAEYRNSYGGSLSLSDTIELTAPAVTGTLAINSGATSTTTRAVTLNSSVTGATEMIFRDQGGTWTDWEPYAATRAWTLPAGAGTKVVEATYRGEGGSLWTSDAIELTSGPIIYVNAATGSDTTGDGSLAKPYKSITMGMSVASAGKTIDVAEGSYGTTATAESFPILLKTGVTVQGHGREVTLVEGDPANYAFEANGTGIVLRDLGIEDADTGVDFWAGYEALVTGCTFTRCGRGIYLARESTATVTGCLFQDAGSCGLGAEMSGHIYANDCTVAHSTSPGVQIDGATLVMTDSTVRDGHGAALRSTFGTLALARCDFYNNASGNGAGGIDLYDCDLVASDCQVHDNTGEYKGGGVVAFYSTLDFISSEINTNTVLDNSTSIGGGIYAEETDVHLVGTTVDGNTARDAGGMHVVDNTARSSLLMEGGSASRNTATLGTGGAVSLYGSVDATISGAAIEANTAYAVSAINGQLHLGGRLVLDGTDVIGNVTTNDWGAIKTGGPDPFLITRSRLCDNVGGGTAAFFTNTTGLIENSLIAGNVSDGTLPWGAIGHNTSTDDMTINACTIADNSPGGVTGSAVTHVRNSVLWGNADEWGNVDDVRFPDENVDVQYCDISEEYPGTGNIHVDPAFVESAGGDYRLTDGSPCIDAANDASSPADDHDHIIRPQDGDLDGATHADMGAFERPGFTVEDGAEIIGNTLFAMQQSFEGATQVRYDTGTGFSTWMPVTDEREWNFETGDGSKTVRAEFAYGGGLYTTIVSDTVTLDTTGPSIGTLASTSHPDQADYYSDSSADMTWSASDPSGVAGYSWSIDQVALAAADTSVDGAGGSATASVGDDGVWYFHVRAVDGVGNWGPTSHYTVRVDTHPPAGFIAIANGAPYTNTASVTVSCTAVADLTDMQMRWSVNAGSTWTSWEDYAASKSLTLPAGDGNKNVLGQFKDASGNSSEWSDEITLDSTSPSVTAVTSATHPSETVFYTARDVTMNVSAEDPGGSGVSAFSWSLDDSSLDVPDPVADGISSTIALADVPDGVWYFHVRARDAAGNWSPTSTRVVRIGSDASYVERVSGATRYETALQVSQACFAGADTVLIATGANFADALAGAGLAGSYRAPLLLTPKDSLAPGILSEIGRLGATRVIILGGYAAVAANVQDALQAPGRAVSRIQGADRYATAAEIARALLAREGDAFVHEAFVARGDNFADALASSPLAYARKMPILLVKPTSMPSGTSAVISTLDLERVYVTGGTAAVADSVASAFGVDYDRYGGPDRYATAGIVAEAGAAEGWAVWDTIGVATGTNFPDALGGGVGVGERGGVLLLTKPTELPASTAGALAAHRTRVAAVEVFGGTGAVSDTVRTAIRDALR